MKVLCFPVWPNSYRYFICQKEYIIAMKRGGIHMQLIEEKHVISVISHDSCMVSVVPSSDKMIMLICHIMRTCCSVIGPCRHAWVARFLHAQGAWEVALEQADPELWRPPH